MKEKAISFCRRLIPRVMDGSKTMTRRTFEPQPEHINFATVEWFQTTPSPNPERVIGYYEDGESKEIKLRYERGDILWVKEEYYEYGHWVVDGKTETGKDKMKFVPDGNYDKYPICYRDTMPPEVVFGKGKGSWGWYWRNPRFMPRYAARLFLRVTGVRVERLREITEKDAVKEGFKAMLREEGSILHTARELFEVTWNDLNGKRGFGWDSNPYVFVVEFERLTEGKC
jgi:hypothetical protein